MAQALLQAYMIYLHSEFQPLNTWEEPSSFLNLPSVKASYLSCQRHWGFVQQNNMYFENGKNYKWLKALSKRITAGGIIHKSLCAAIAVFKRIKLQYSVEPKQRQVQEHITLHPVILWLLMTRGGTSRFSKVCRFSAFAGGKDSAQSFIVLD